MQKYEELKRKELKPHTHSCNITMLVQYIHLFFSFSFFLFLLPLLQIDQFQSGTLWCGGNKHDVKTWAFTCRVVLIFLWSLVSLRVIFLQVGVDGKVSFVIVTLLSLWLPDYKKNSWPFFCGVEISWVESSLDCGCFEHVVLKQRRFHNKSNLLSLYYGIFHYLERCEDNFTFKWRPIREVRLCARFRAFLF